MFNYGSCGDVYSQQTDGDVPKRRGLTEASPQHVRNKGHSHGKDYYYDDDDDDDDILIGKV